MTPESKGRIDWMPHKKVWRVILYHGLRDVPAGDYLTQAAATSALQEAIAGSPGRRDDR